MKLGIGKILKHIRVFNHYKQRELAEKLNISRSYISTLETTHRFPSMEILRKYSDSFDISLSAILFLAETENPNYKDKNNLRKKAKIFVGQTTINFLNWICKEDKK